VRIRVYSLGQLVGIVVSRRVTVTGPQGEVALTAAGGGTEPQGTVVFCGRGWTKVGGKGLEI